MNTVRPTTTNDYAFFGPRDINMISNNNNNNNNNDFRNKQRRQLFLQISRKSLPYQIIKYVLLILNIMIVATTAIITIIVCLLPTIIYEKKLALDTASTFLRTGNLSPPSSAYGNHHQHHHHQQSANRNRFDEQEIIQLSAQEIDTIRLIRYVILGLSALIILNQTLAVYGLFKERSYYILLTTVVIGLIGQLGLFVLPASIYILVTIYLIFSICYVILLNHLNMMSKEPAATSAILAGRSPSRASSMEPPQCRSGQTCCCRCKTCLCNQTHIPPPPPSSSLMEHQLNRKPSIQSHGVPYYYGSLGRRSRDSRTTPSSATCTGGPPANQTMTSSMGPTMPAKTSQMTMMMNDVIYAHRPPYRSSPLVGLPKPIRKVSNNMNLIDSGVGGSYSFYPQSRAKQTSVEEQIPLGDYSALDRSRDTTIM